MKVVYGAIHLAGLHNNFISAELSSYMRSCQMRLQFGTPYLENDIENM